MPRFFLAILDTMWGVEGDAPHRFTINPRNHSGRRLYRLTGASEGELWVTNACPEQTRHASLHGTPSTDWLRQSFSQIPARWRAAPLLVCGAVAQRTYNSMMAERRPRFSHRGPVIYTLHPAARTWTKAMIANMQKQIQRSQ